MFHALRVVAVLACSPPADQPAVRDSPPNPVSRSTSPPGRTGTDRNHNRRNQWPAQCPARIVNCGNGGRRVSGQTHLVLVPAPAPRPAPAPEQPPPAPLLLSIGYPPLGSQWM